jgi:bacillithiol system protein YtxJ
VTASLQVLRSLEDLDAAIAASFSRPVVLFKHSPTCGTSAMAHEEIDEWLAGPPLGADAYVVPVQASRPVAQAIASTFHVRHESPQVLLIVQGEVKWHASHFHVNAAEIRAALGRVAGLEGTRPG